MIDHIFLTVRDMDRSIAFYDAVLPMLGITSRLDYQGASEVEGPIELKGFGAKGRMFFWLRKGTPAPGAVHVGFVADSEDQVNATHAQALSCGAVDVHPPGAQRHYDPRYYAAQVKDPDGYSLEFVYKSWQH